MGPSAGGQPTGELATAIDKDLADSRFSGKAFSDAAANRFAAVGPGLSSTGQTGRRIHRDQDSPLMVSPSRLAGIPILGLDVWSTYYLKYQNRVRIRHRVFH